MKRDGALFVVETPNSEPPISTWCRLKMGARSIVACRNHQRAAFPRSEIDEHAVRRDLQRFQETQQRPRPSGDIGARVRAIVAGGAEPAPGDAGARLRSGAPVERQIGDDRGGDFEGSAPFSRRCSKAQLSACGRTHDVRHWSAIMRTGRSVFNGFFQLRFLASTSYPITAVVPVEFFGSRAAANLSMMRLQISVIVTVRDNSDQCRAPSRLSLRGEQGPRTHIMLRSNPVLPRRSR